MSADSKVSTSNGGENPSISEEQQEKINEIRRLLGPLPEKLSIYCSDAMISRYLRARNWNVKKATKMLKETLKWRLQYKPEDIRWDDIASEAETGKIYRSTYADKHGRIVLVMRPGCQNSKSVKGQIRFLVYCMENAVINLPQHQEEMVWLIDYKGCNLSHFSLKATRETAHVLQEHYPERLGVAILYNPPKFFEPFYTVVKPFLEPKTANKVKFVYSDDPKTMNIMDSLFDMDQLESVFGGKNNAGFDIDKYAERMREDDKKMTLFWVPGNASEVPHQPATTADFLDPANLELDSHASDEKDEESSSHAHDVEENFPNDNLAVENSSSSIAIAEVK